MPIGVGVSTFLGEKRYDGVKFNVISVTRGCVGVQFSGKKRYGTLEWPLTAVKPGGSERWTFSETMDIRDFTVCIIRCVYPAGLILGT